MSGRHEGTLTVRTRNVDSSGIGSDSFGLGANSAYAKFWTRSPDRGDVGEVTGPSGASVFVGVGDWATAVLGSVDGN